VASGGKVKQIDVPPDEVFFRCYLKDIYSLSSTGLIKVEIIILEAWKDWRLKMSADMKQKY
jgi:hypothetical protein